MPKGFHVGWTGREVDAETGMSFHRARYYSPELRRWTQEDPIGYRGGANLYAYVDGRVLEARDPSGLYYVCHAVFAWHDRGANPGGGGGTIQVLEFDHCDWTWVPEGGSGGGSGGPGAGGGGGGGGGEPGAPGGGGTDLPGLPGAPPKPGTPGKQSADVDPCALIADERARALAAGLLNYKSQVVGAHTEVGISADQDFNPVEMFRVGPLDAGDMCPFANCRDITVRTPIERTVLMPRTRNMLHTHTNNWLSPGDARVARFHNVNVIGVNVDGRFASVYLPNGAFKVCKLK